MGKRDAAGRFESMRLYMYQQSEDDTISATSLHGEGSAKLFSAELDGRSFERIRREEKLLVEYQQFLQNVVCLFEQAYACSNQGLQSVPYQTLDCGTTNQAGSQTESRQKFRIVLHIAGHGQCKLEFLECNAFRELAHLTLSLQANSDAGMNSFLLFRLREIMEENETLLSTIETLRRDGDAIQCDMLKSQVSNANDQCELLKNKLHDLESTNLSLHKELSSKEQDMESLREQTKRLNDTIESYKRNSVSAEEITSQSSREISRLKELCEGYKCASDMADARVDDWKRMSKTHEKQSQERAEKIKALEEKIAQLSRDAAHANQELHDIQARTAARDCAKETRAGPKTRERSNKEYSVPVKSYGVYIQVSSTSFAPSSSTRHQPIDKTVGTIDGGEILLHMMMMMRRFQEPSRSREKRYRRSSRDRYRRRSRDRYYYSSGSEDERRRPYSREHRRRVNDEAKMAVVEDPFAALRSAAAGAVDPAEMARKMQEQQLRARQLVLQQQAVSAVKAASRTQREVYIGGIVPGVVTEPMLRELFRATLTAAFPDKCQNGTVDPVISITLAPEQKFCFYGIIVCGYGERVPGTLWANLPHGRSFNNWKANWLC
eukprot:jgi/Picre1/30654/NNA_006015.t1